MLTKEGIEESLGLSDASSDDGGHISHHEESDATDEARHVAEKETLRVRACRFITADVLIMISCIISLTSYAVLRDMEKENLEHYFDQYSQTLSLATLEHQTATRHAMQSFATSIESWADPTIWPLFTPPNFEAQAQKVKNQVGLQSLLFAPLVTKGQKEEWVSYATQAVADMEQIGVNLNDEESSFHPFITQFDEAQDNFVEDAEREYYFPSLAWSPVATSKKELNWNLASAPQNQAAIETFLFHHGNEIALVSPPPKPMESPHVLTLMICPIYQRDGKNDNTSNNSNLLGIVSGGISWESGLKNILPEDASPIDVVISSSSDSCDASFSFEVDGPNVKFKGYSNLYDSFYEEYEMTVDLAVDEHNTEEPFGHCQFQMTLYPTRALEMAHRTHFPEISSLALAFVMVVLAASFWTYDLFTDRRNEKLVEKFARSNAIVSSLFPRAYRDRLMADGDGDTEGETLGGASGHSHHTLKNIMSHGDARLSNATTGVGGVQSKPLADIFPHVSILFADINGFTAWSSVREPSQVFTLLETLYASFDEVAKRRCIFKVETVGDCYVAACGLPNPRADHAVLMVRFASDILTRMHVLTREMEVTLGPDTGDLNLRIGINSGPVTAGILRGEKARFQLFGDTMNTASRAESLGLPGRIQVTESTAELLIKSGHGHWLQKRPDKIAAKGKGLMQTYFVTGTSGGSRSGNGSTTSGSSHEQNLGSSYPDEMKETKVLKQKRFDKQPEEVEDKKTRLVRWNLESMLTLIKQIMARRKSQEELVDQTTTRRGAPNQDETFNGISHNDPLDEVKEIISLPEFDGLVARSHYMDEEQYQQMTISTVVVDQLRTFLTALVSRYNDNEFHSFEHASHVTMSICKLLSRIVAPWDDLDATLSKVPEGPDGDAFEAATRHDHTYGITSDPLTQFACIFSGLIHDVDHTGVPNAQLVKEKSHIATKYNGKSVAEQHSLDIAWDLFMSKDYDEMRLTICATPSELRRFRELVVNCVMATDIADKELKTLRNLRWEKAFHPVAGFQEANPRDAVNRKATIVIEHLMQASDVAHTMQHWHVYQKWNERFFRECYRAYIEGRAETDPSINWYKGEIGFFDFYIIPLAKKLKDCGVFGVSSDEYLNYAQQNRKEWESRGEAMVQAMIEKIARPFSNESVDAAI